MTEEGLDKLLQEHYLRSSPRWDELFRRSLEHGHMMLQRRANADGEVGWTIYHDAFRNHLLTTEVVRDNGNWAQERWLKVCAQWQKLEQEAPSLYRYALRHYAEHLHEIPDKLPELFELARNDEFAKLRSKFCPMNFTFPS